MVSHQVMEIETGQENSLTKLDLNNQIVGMRHNVKRAKVQTLNKLTHKIKLLRNKKGPDNIKEKNLAKAERLLQEFLVMKKIPPDEVAAFSLSNTKKVDNILEDVNSSWRLKALARLSIHKSIAPIVELFRSKYPTWEKDFPKVLIALKKRKKLKLDDKVKGNKTQTPHGTSKNSNKVSGNKNLEPESNNNEMDSEEEASDFDDCDSESDRITGNDKLDQNLGYVQTRGNRFSISSDDSNVSNFNNKKMDKSKKVNTKLHNELNVSQEFKSDASKDETNFSNNGSATEDDVSSEMEQDNLQNVEGTQKYVDPFFIGSNDEEYETLNPINEMTEKDEAILFKRPQLDDSDIDPYRDSNKYKRDFSNNRAGNFRNEYSSKRDSNFKNKRDSFSKNRETYSNPVNRFSNEIKQFNKRNNKFNDKNKVGMNKESSQLHPSWEAKKKLNSVSISNIQFSGKKIVFD